MSTHAPTGSVAQTGSQSRGGRAALLAGLLVIASWYLLVVLRRPAPIADEHYHAPAIQALAEGNWGPVRALPMLPTYHILMAAVARVLGSELWILRALTAVPAGLAVALYYAAVQARGNGHGEHDVLRFAWHPLLLPYAALVYTDTASLAAVLLALNAYLRSRHVLTAAALLLACLIRQDNVVWAAFFAALAVTDLWRAQPKSDLHPRSLLRFAWQEALPAHWPYVLALAGGASLTLLHTGPTHAPELTKALRLNPAQGYIFALTAALLWLPWWLVHLREFWPRRFEPILLWPRACAAAVGLVGLLALVFRNPHPWNLDLSFLRNWPLYAMTYSVGARFLFAAVIVLFIATLVHTIRGSPARRILALTWLCGLLGALPHYLVDPRYYIITLVLAEFFTPRSTADTRRLTAWYFVLSLGAGFFIVGRSGGGVW